MTAEDQEPLEDLRIYVLNPEQWRFCVKLDWEKEYCYFQNPGEDYYHSLLKGEVYVQREYEKVCLNCAWRKGLLTRDRVHWKRR